MWGGVGGVPSGGDVGPSRNGVGKNGGAEARVEEVANAVDNGGGSHNEGPSGGGIMKKRRHKSKRRPNNADGGMKRPDHLMPIRIWRTNNLIHVAMISTEVTVENLKPALDQKLREDARKMDAKKLEIHKLYLKERGRGGFSSFGQNYMRG